MQNLKYVAFLMSVGLLGFSPTIVHADNTNVAIVAETFENDSGIVTNSAIELSIPSNLVYEKQEIQLDSIPSDLHVDLPTNITLEALNDNQYGYTDRIKISCDSDNEYRVELSLKDTNITYVSSDGNTVKGVATIGDSTSYSWSYDDVASGLEIPLSVVVDKPEYIGSYTTALNFSINVYQMQEVEVKTEENASVTKDIGKSGVKGNKEVKEDTKVKDKKVTSKEEVKEDTQVSDKAKVEPSTSEKNTVVADNTSVSGVAFENTDTIFISKDITSIDADACNNLDLLKVINFEGTKEEWNKIFTGSLKSGVVLNFNSSMIGDSTVVPTETTSSKVEDSQSDKDNSSRDLTIEDSQPTTKVESVDCKSSRDSFEITESADSVNTGTESAASVSSSIDE